MVCIQPREKLLNHKLLRDCIPNFNCKRNFALAFFWIFNEKTYRKQQRDKLLNSNYLETVFLT